jgi:hypothetical protein
VSGTLMLARPRVLPKMLGLDGGSPALRWLPRLLAIREIAFAVAAVAASARAENPLPWLCPLAAVHGAEAIVLFGAVLDHAVPRERGRPFIASDLGSAFAGVGAVAHLTRQHAPVGSSVLS